MGAMTPSYNDCDCVPGHRCDCWDHRATPVAVPDRSRDWWTDGAMVNAEEDIAHRLTAWAGCVQRLIKVAPTSAVMDETGARFSGGGHSTPPERTAIREAAARIVAGWLTRDLAALRDTPVADTAGIDANLLRERIGAVITRWYHLGLIRFSERDDGSDDLILRDELLYAALRTPKPEGDPE